MLDKLRGLERKACVVFRLRVSECCGGLGGVEQQRAVKDLCLVQVTASEQRIVVKQKKPHLINLHNATDLAQPSFRHQMFFFKS